MNVISIFGGPRKKGNTATILGWVEEELKTLGHQIERIKFANQLFSVTKAPYSLLIPGGAPNMIPGIG